MEVPFGSSVNKMLSRPKALVCYIWYNEATLIKFQWERVRNKEFAHSSEVLQIEMGNWANEVASKTKETYALGSWIFWIGSLLAF